MISGPVTSRIVTSVVSGISSPLPVRTYTSRMSSGWARNSASDCRCTRNTRPARLKSLTYSAPNVLCSVSNTSATLTPSSLAFSRSRSMRICGTLAE